MKKCLEAIPRLIFPDDGSEENKKEFTITELLVFYCLISNY